MRQFQAVFDFELYGRSSSGKQVYFSCSFAPCASRATPAVLSRVRASKRNQPLNQRFQIKGPSSEGYGCRMGRGGRRLVIGSDIPDSDIDLLLCQLRRLVLKPVSLGRGAHALVHQVSDGGFNVAAKARNLNGAQVR